MKAYLEQFLKDFNYPKEAQDALLNAYNAIYASNESRVWQQLLLSYEKDYNIDFNEVLKTCRHIADRLTVHRYTIELLIFICFSRHLRTLYKEKGIEDSIWQESMEDLLYKLWECYEVKGVWGSFVAHWFGEFFNLTRFQLGRLQFELFPFSHFLSEGTYNKNGLCLLPDTTIINVHIPRNGKPIDKESCDLSYERAKKFFIDVLNKNPKAFLCYSWLLYPENSSFLHANSNVKRFMEEYDIIHSITYNEEEQFCEMWRLFDMDFTGDVNDYPEKGTLQKVFKKHLLSGGKTGVGLGVKKIF